MYFSKVVAALFIAITIVLLANNVTSLNKQRDVEAKFVELATVILNKEPIAVQLEDSKSLRKWAVDVINKFSSVPLSAQAETALIEKEALPSASLASIQSESTNFDITWGLIFGVDPTLKAANQEVTVTAKSLGVQNALIFRRSGSYRSVKIYIDRFEADEALTKAKAIRATPYLLNVAKWCPTSIQRDGYFECNVL